jgi:MoxR-like ATPase
MSVDNSLQRDAETFRQRYQEVKSEIGKVIVGHDEIVHGVLTSLMIGGHCLLEGAPGLGKTLLVRTLAQVLDLDFSRIQFTPDLMPADILGTSFSEVRFSPRSAWPTKSTGRLPRRSRRCWRRCRREP